MKADYDSQADAISIELRSFDHYDEQEQVDDDYCTVRFERGRPVNVSILSPAEHVAAPGGRCRAYDLSGVALIAITRAALSAPDRVVELESRLTACRRLRSAMADYTIKHRDEFESMEGSGDSTWRLARKALGTSAFGFNLVEIDPGGQIPEHDENESGQVELYAILEGEACCGSRARTIRPPPAPSPRSSRRPAARSSTAPRPRHRAPDRRPARGRLRADGLGLSLSFANCINFAAWQIEKLMQFGWLAGFQCYLRENANLPDREGLWPYNPPTRQPVARPLEEGVETGRSAMSRYPVP